MPGLDMGHPFVVVKVRHIFRLSSLLLIVDSNFKDILRSF